MIAISFKLFFLILKLMVPIMIPFLCLWLIWSVLKRLVHSFGVNQS